MDIGLWDKKEKFLAAPDGILYMHTIHMNLNNWESTKKKKKGKKWEAILQFMAVFLSFLWGV